MGLGGVLGVRLSPCVWLHRRQMILALSGWSVPPRDAGVMWSTSGLLGRRLFSQSSGMAHTRPGWCWQFPVQGQWVRCRSRWRTVRTVAFHREVPVRDVAMTPSGDAKTPSPFG